MGAIVSDLEQAVCAQLERWGLAGSALGAQAVDLARRLSPRRPADLRPAAAAMLHAQLRAVLADLAKLAPADQTADGIDDLSRRRDERRRAAGEG